MTLYRIKDWAKHFENNRTKELKRLTWVPVPNKMDGDGYTELVSHPDGAAHLGAWLAMIEVASKCDVRGTLSRDGATGVIPHDSQSLSRISRIPAAVFDAAIPRLIRIGWLTSEVIASTTVTTIPQEGAGKSHEGAAKSQESALNGMEGNGMEGNTSASDDAGKKKRPKKEPSGDHAELVRYFATVWKTKLGSEYVFCDGKDGSAVKRILKGVKGDLAWAKRIVDAYIDCGDPFLQTKGYPLTLLEINRWKLWTQHGAQRDGFTPKYDTTEVDDLLLNLEEDAA